MRRCTLSRLLGIQANRGYARSATPHGFLNESGTKTLGLYGGRRVYAAQRDCKGQTRVHMTHFYYVTVLHLEVNE